MTSRNPRGTGTTRLAAGAIIRIIVLLIGVAAEASANDPVAAVIAAKCLKCHGQEMPKGGIDLRRIGSAENSAAPAELLQRVLDAIDANDMPPETEPQLTPNERGLLLRSVKDSLKKATAATKPPRAGVFRLTRFQYNNAVRDLFQLDRDVFALSEKLMTRRDRYLPAATGTMPERVNVEPSAWRAPPEFRGVKPFPKDLRAEHGFDNQADKLTLSPLLLDAFLRLSVSIVESPDFNSQTVGVWGEFFREPPSGVDQSVELQRRLKPFLRLAFRRPVDDATLARYVAYADAKMRQGTSFTDSLKKVASAVLCSPMFLYRSAAADGSESQFELASQLSFFLWSSIPDRALLDQAERGELAQPAVLQRTIERLMGDPKIERFLDAFPTQWMQLENALAITPDPKKARYFHLDENHPASAVMVLEPLLLFDAVFAENRPIVELISPSFTYRNEFLSAWYETPLVPPKVDAQELAAKNRVLTARRHELENDITSTHAEIAALLKPVREKLLDEKKRSRDSDAANSPRDLKPLAVWEFNGDLKDSVGSLHLTAHENVKQEADRIVIERGYLQSSPLKVDLKAKTLEVWCTLPEVTSKGGGLMSIQGPGDVFDSIVLGERQKQHWISGSNFFARTEDFPESNAETAINERLHLTMVYQEDGTTRLYRNGVAYGKPFRKGAVVFPKDQTKVLFGLRHLPPGGNKYLKVAIDKARLYDRALTADEVVAAASEFRLDISEQQLVDMLPAADGQRYQAAHHKLSRLRDELAKAPQPQDLKLAQLEVTRRYEDELRAKLHSPVFQRLPLNDSRYGGIITNTAVLSMTSGPQRTQPIARGSWIIEVVFNDPPPPPPNNVPPLKEDDNANLTIREQFAAHRANPSCAGCHAKIDPLGFALENFDITGRWRDTYENGRPVDATGTLFRKHKFTGATNFKAAIVDEKQRFARAFTTHLLRFALARELTPGDLVSVDVILDRAGSEDFRLQTLIRESARALAR